MSHQDLMKEMSGEKSKLEAVSFAMPELTTRNVSTVVISGLMAVGVFKGEQVIQSVGDFAAAVDKATIPNANAAPVPLGGNIEVDTVCVGPNKAQTTFRLIDFTQDDIAQTRLGVSSSGLTTVPDMPYDQQTPLTDLLSPSRIDSDDGVAEPVNTGQEPYNGATKVTVDVAPGDRVMATYSRGGPAETPGSSGGSVRGSSMDCSGGTPPVVVVPPVITTPTVAVCEFKAGLLASTPSRVPPNGRGVLKVGAFIDPISTGFVGGEGTGKRAAHFEVKFNSAVKLMGRLAPNMTAYRNGKLVKKGDGLVPNTVSIDIPNNGLTKTNRLNANIRFLLPKGKGKFTVTSVLPGNTIKFDDPACQSVSSVNVNKATATVKK